jgi:hypothetical protein
LPLYFAAGVTHFERNMRRFASSVWTLVLLAVAAPGARGGAMADAPAFSEVYNLVREHLRSVTPAELDHAAMEGLIAALHPRVTLVTNGTPEPSSASLLSQARRLENNVGYLRIATVAEGLADALAQAHRELSRTGSLVGLVLDVRYANGENYEAVAAVTGLLSDKPSPLLRLDDAVIPVRPAAERVGLPAAVLVNRQTIGAAEALAAALRFKGAALILGSETAGAAAAKQEFTLATGHKLRIAAAPVKLADGTPLAPKGVQPDIAVTVSEAEERWFFVDAYREPPSPAELASGDASPQPASSTNRLTRRPRPSEADLVRARREGLPLDGDLMMARETEPPPPVLRDPTLARAVDLLKGLAVVRAGRN